MQNKRDDDFPGWGNGFGGLADGDGESGDFYLYTKDDYRFGYSYNGFIQYYFLRHLNTWDLSFGGGKSAFSTDEIWKKFNG